jgi:hypothetical protein
MLIQLLEAMNERTGTLAMLCKSSVARKVLLHGWKNKIPFERSAIYRINAVQHFDAAVEAVLLVMHFRPDSHDLEARVLPDLSDVASPTIIGYEDGSLFADITAFHRWKHLSGEEIINWRSGIKHDCSKVMELRRELDGFRNGFGELVNLEETYVFPMLKSSDVANGGGRDDGRCMIVTQRVIGGDTFEIQQLAPRTWDYLNRHVALLEKRGSSIYRNRPPFSIFGVGEYSFAPWKVAISGFYKKLTFVKVGSVTGKPVVLDDTSYFLPCQSEEEAVFLAALLNSPPAQAFYNAFVFWDAKRPITAELLRRLDLRQLAQELSLIDQFDALYGKLTDSKSKSTLRGRKKKEPFQLELWHE